MAICEAQGGADRLAAATTSIKPEIDWVRDAALEADQRISQTAAQIGEQQDRFAALLASVDDGVGEAQSKISELASVIVQAQREAGSLSAETGPALVAALVQVKEAAAHAAERAREAIEAVIPDSAGKLSQATRDALETVIRESIEDRLREVETTAARAVESAREASARLSQQMLNLGQSASALEAHVEATSKDQRDKDSEAFARRVSLLIDSMNSAAIDVGKILSDEIDDKAGIPISRAIAESLPAARSDCSAAANALDPRLLRRRPRVPAGGQPLRPRFRSDAPPGARGARRRDDCGDPDVVGYGQAVRGACRSH